MKKSSATHTLIVYNEIPDRCTLVLVPNDDLDDADRKVLNAAQGMYINGDATEEGHHAVDCIGNALTTKPEYLSDGFPVGSKWAMRFVNYARSEGGERKSMKKFQGVLITNVIHCGFFM